MSRTPVEVSADLACRRLREDLTDAQIVELTHVVALENLRGRFNLALGIGAAGSSQGRVCGLTTPPPTPQRLDGAAGRASQRRS